MLLIIIKRRRRASIECWREPVNIVEKGYLKRFGIYWSTLCLTSCCQATTIKKL